MLLSRARRGAGRRPARAPLSRTSDLDTRGVGEFLKVLQHYNKREIGEIAAQLAASGHSQQL